MAHQAVLVKEVITWLKPRVGEVVVDATINHGGHARAVAEYLGTTGRLIGIDQDEGAIAIARATLSPLVTCRLELLVGNFRHLAKLLAQVEVKEVDGILFDLGWSSDQLEHSGRGFSFKQEEPLLLTYQAKPGATDLTGQVIVNTWSEEELVTMLREYGEEQFALRIAAAIVHQREEQPILTTSQLVEIIRLAVPRWYTHRRLHFATKTFQALRIAVNDELVAITEGLNQAWAALTPRGGRLVVISFHSLEARLVKNIFRSWADRGEGERLTKHAIKPDRAEIVNNPRSRSAQLRAIRKLSPVK